MDELLGALINALACSILTFLSSRINNYRKIKFINVYNKK